MGHEAIGVVEAVGSGVSKVKPGDFVIMPFAYSDGRCEFCHEGLQTACVHGGFFGFAGLNGAQAEALRVPQADGTLYTVPGGTDEALMASLLSLSDVMGTGHHAARIARVGPGKKVAVVGDGAVGLCGVIAARRLGAEQIILIGRHPDRVALGRDFGATDIVTERGDEAVERVLALSGGHGVHSVLECVGTEQAVVDAVAITRPGGAIGRVGVPHYSGIPAGPDVLQERHRRWRSCAGEGLHRRALAGCPRRPHPARPRVRPCHRPRAGARRLPRDGRARGAQSNDRPLINAS